MNYFRCGGGRSTHTATKIDVAKTPLATFESNVSGLYIPEILAYIQATQSGTGDHSPSNPRAINGVSSVDTMRTGKNLFDNASPILNKYLTNEGTERDTSGWNISDYIPIKGGQTYHFNPNSTLGAAAYGFFYTDNSIDAVITLNRFESGEITITAPDNAKYVRFSYRNTSSNIQLELGNTATAYEAYTGQTATINLGGTYYGGYLNVTTGLLTVTHLGVDMGSLEWTYNATDNYFNVSESRIKSDTIPEVMCEQFTYRGRGSSSTMSTAPTDSIYYYTNALRVKDTRFTDKNSFITAVSGQLVMFELKETAYETYQLTPAQIEQMLGQNNVFCSSGDVAVKYWKID